MPASHQGETLLADGRKVFQALPQEIIYQFKTKGVYYRKIYYNKCSAFSFRKKVLWAQAFNSCDLSDVEKQCKDLGYEFKWNSKGLITSNKLPGLLCHPVTNDQIFFNHLSILLPKGLIRRFYYKLFILPQGLDMRYGDGTRIKNKTINQIHSCLEQTQVPHKWEKYDILWIDNILCMHGRMPYKGKRTILSAMVP